MNFKDILSKLPTHKGGGQTSEVFFALDISSKKVVAALWALEGKRLHILNTAEENYSHHSEIIEAANNALDNVLADYPYDPSKVLFGVPENWLQDDNLKEAELKLLRGLTKELDITPMAFVSRAHALSHFLQKQTGAPITAVLVEYSDPIVLTVVKGGKVFGSREVKHSDNVCVDIEKGLMSFDEVEVLPSRMLVYGERVPVDLKEMMTSFPWMSKLPFLHLPKIDILDSSCSIQAVCFAGASEIEGDVVYSPENRKVGDRKKGIGVVSMDEQDVHKHKDLEKVGFVEGDIEQVGEEEVAASYMPDEEYGRHSGAVAKYSQNPVVERFSSVLSVPGQLLSGLSKGRGGGSRLGKLIFVLAAVLLLVGVLAAYLIIVKARVDVFIDAKILEREAQVVADPGISAVDEGGKKIPGKIIEAAVTETLKGSASGKKQIGDPAKGKVIIYNKTSASRSFSQGTVFTSGNGLKFTLDSSVSVASQSATPGPDQSTILKPGKSDAVGVTASAIGPESNLAAGTNLTVSGFGQNDVLATVDSALSGGTSKDITTVTADDQKRLLAEVASSARKKAKETIQGKLTGDFKVLEEGLQEMITKQSYSKAVGDQASEFNLTLNASYKGTAYSDTDLKTMVAKSIETTVPEGYQLNLADTETQAAATKIEKDGKLIFTAKFKAKLVPKIDLEKVKKDIAGKSLEEAGVILRRIENVVGTSFEFNPKIPRLLQRVPILTRNIAIEVTAK